MQQLYVLLKIAWKNNFKCQKHVSHHAYSKKLGQN